MDPNLKTLSWDSTQFEEEMIPNFRMINGFTNLGGQSMKGDFSVDLKLGQVLDFQNDSAHILKVPSVPKMEATSPSGSSKRARVVNNGVQRASCLVDGCKADLNCCREYYKRHKVCELHSKTPQVLISGHKKRFCQQCSRFHSLEEFDDGKRSCRKRLDGHNRRRRKPQPETRSNSQSFLSNFQGGRLFSFSMPQVYSTATTAPNPEWGEVFKFEQSKLPGSSSTSSSYKGCQKQFSFLQGTTLELGNQTVPEASVLDGSANQAYNSDCALSLLSSPPPPPHTLGLGLSHVSNPLAHPFNLSSHYNGLETGSVLVSNACDTEVPCPGMFYLGAEESPGNESPQTLPFYWE